MKAKRGRNFATIIYPDSCLDNFKDIIKSWHIPAFLSPLHDKDVDENGVIKKAHYHLLVKFDGCKSEDQVKLLFDQIGGVGVEFVNEFRSYARYLCHLDEVDDHKTLYDPNDVWSSSPVSYLDLIKTSDDVLDVLDEIQDFITTYQVKMFDDLAEYCRKYNRKWYKLITSGYTMYITHFLKAQEYGKNHPDLYVLRNIF